MAINSKTLSSVQSKVTGLTTNETDFRAGVDDALTQIDASEVLLSNVDSADLVKLAAVTSTAAELNVLDGITSSTSELNITDGLTATTSELNILDGATLTTAELNLLDGVTSTTAELNKLDGYTGTYEDLNKIADVTATAAELNTLDGFTGNTADLNRTVELDAAGNGTSGQVLTSDGDGTYSWTTPSSFTFVIEDEDGTEVSIDTDEIKFQGDGMDIDWGAGDGTDGNPYILNIDNADKGSSQNIFKNIAVSGQTSIQADSNNDTLTIAGGDNITVTTNAGTDTLTISGDVDPPGNGTIRFTGGDVTSTATFGLNSSNSTDVVLYIGAQKVDTAELKNNSVTPIKMEGLAGDGSAGQILSSNGSLGFEWVSQLGTSRISDNAITGAKLAHDHRIPSSSSDTYNGNTHDFTFYDASVGIRWYTAGAEEMRLTDAGDLHVDGNVTAYSTTVSDPRLKDDVTIVENALDKVCQLNGYEFKYKRDGRKSAGILTTELKKVLPSAVTETKIPWHSENDEMYEIAHYDQMTALFIEAIKDLEAKIQELESKL